MEHKRQKVAPIKIFLFRQFRYALFALLLIGVSLAIGVFGYRFIGNFSWLDSFHMSSMILTGMGPVILPRTSAAKLFDSFYALYSGVAFLSVSAVFFAPLFHRLLHILQVEDDDSGDES